MTENKISIKNRRSAWEDVLSRIQAEPLRHCPSFPETARRWNDWWRFEADRPLIIAETGDGADIRRDKAFDLLRQPDEWLRVRRLQMEHTRYAGEALPFVRVDIGPVAMAAFLGAPLHFAGNEQTSWHDPVIESWEGGVRLELDPDNHWLRTVMQVMEKLAADAKGNYLVCLPDLTGATDTLMNLRSMQKLCFDLYEYSDEILDAAADAVKAWETVFARMYDLVLGAGAGVTQWVSCWADRPFTVPTCDFNALIGPEDFRNICMPSLKEQARRAGLCVFHLDGPDAARHALTLAEDPDINAIQYTPGAGTPSALAMLEMFHMIQEREVPLFIECPAEEARQLADELDPGGTALRIAGPVTCEEARALVQWRDGR